jgi:hypothetical protein
VNHGVCVDLLDEITIVVGSHVPSVSVSEDTTLEIPFIGAA